MIERVLGTREVRVATLNLWGLHGEWEERRSVLVDGLRELRPDVIAFQEAVLANGYDQVADLLGARYHVAHHAGREANGSGCSVASRWPLGEVQEVDLRVTARVYPHEYVGRSTAAEVLAPEPIGPLLLVNHKPSGRLGFEHERELQAVAASRFVEELVGKREVSYVVLPATSTSPRTPLACASGAGCSPWVARASATGTPGRAPTLGFPVKRSRRATRW